MDLIQEKNFLSNVEKQSITNLTDNLFANVIPRDQILSNLGLFLTSKNLARILFFNHIYQQIVNIQGQILDLGTRWGNNISILTSLRSIYEPFNRHRKIIGFDTFEGFPDISPQDGNSDLMVPGNLQTGGDKYVCYLADVLAAHEQLNPISHINKFQLIKGDACKTVRLYFKENPHAIVAFAYFDFDLYKPTKECLQMVKDRIVQGSILAFDELNDADSPGETIALQEVFGLKSVELNRLPFVSRISYFVYRGEQHV